MLRKRIKTRTIAEIELRTNYLEGRAVLQEHYKTPKEYGGRAIIEAELRGFFTAYQDGLQRLHYGD